MNEWMNERMNEWMNEFNVRCHNFYWQTAWVGWNVTYNSFIKKKTHNNIVDNQHLFDLMEPEIY